MIVPQTMSPWAAWTQQTTHMWLVMDRLRCQVSLRCPTARHYGKAFLQSIALTVPILANVVGTMPCRCCRPIVECRRHPFYVGTSYRKGEGP